MAGSDRSSARDPWVDDRPAPDWVGDQASQSFAPKERRTARDEVEQASPLSSRSGASASRPGRSKTGRSRREGGESKPPKPTVAEMTEIEQEELARKILLDQLTGQARSRKELAGKLAKKEIPDALAARLLDRFEEVGLVDDEAFAKAWIASRQPGKGLARRALSQELRRKGIDDEIAREALDEIDPEDEREAGRVLVRRKLRSLARFDDQTKTRRLVGMLARKGYGPGVAFGIVKEELALADDWDDGTEM